MNVLLVRPRPTNERFGLGPFFRIEPLGLEYLAQALVDHGHSPTVIDLRLDRGLGRTLRRLAPPLVGISCMHALEIDDVLATAREVRRRLPRAVIVIGGHAVAIFPEAVEDPAVDAICLGDGEHIIVELCDTVARRGDIAEVAGLRVRRGTRFSRTPGQPQAVSLDSVRLPARATVDRYRTGYRCLQHRPVWLIETARGCPFRCNFCSVWQLYQRSFRPRAVDAVVEDFATTGPDIFVADDLFWHPAARSLELVRALRDRGVRKRWTLVQSRCDLVANHPELLSAWRPVSDSFDIFFGMEAASDAGLDVLDKDADLDATVRAIEVSRRLGYRVVANFVIDPDWEEHDFHELWRFLAAHRLDRAGFTLRTPLPGTELFESMRDRLEGQPWDRYDMHHLLWQPRLGVERFFELYAETWRRTVLDLAGKKRWRDWIAQVHARDILAMTRILWRTQRMMSPAAYLREHR